MTPAHSINTLNCRIRRAILCNAVKLLLPSLFERCNAADATILTFDQASSSQNKDAELLQRGILGHALLSNSYLHISQSRVQVNDLQTRNVFLGH